MINHPIRNWQCSVAVRIVAFLSLMALSTHAFAALEVDIEANPNPAEPGEVLSVKLTVAAPADAALASLMEIL